MVGDLVGEAKLFHVILPSCILVLMVRLLKIWLVWGAIE